MADKETVKFDPVEAAKMKAPSTLFEKKKPEEKPAPPPAKVELVRPPASDAEVEAVLGKRKRYRVKDDVAVHVNGCLTNLMKGQVVSEQHWGVAAIPLLRDQGAVLEEIE
jgi:hypothetical protein